MVVEVLSAEMGSAMSIRIIAPAENPSIRNIVWEEISQPEDVVRCGPSLFAMSIQSMYGNDAVTMGEVVSNRKPLTQYATDLLDDRANALRKDRESQTLDFGRRLRYKRTP